jgi:hypothetical protein
MTRIPAPANTIRIPGTELRDGDTVYLAGRWQVITDVTPEGDNFRATVTSGRMFGNALSMYDIAAR